MLLSDDRKAKILVGSGVYLALIWLCSSLPLPVLFYEFYQFPFCDSNFAWALAKFYGSFYIFPALFGGFALAALYIPFTTAVSLALRHKHVFVLAGVFMGVMTTLICILEFYGSPHAPFQISPQVLSSNERGIDFLNQLRTSCDRAYKSNFEQDIQNVLKLGSRSLSDFMYHFGLFFQVIFLNTLFLVFAVFVKFNKHTVRRETIYLKQSVFFLLTYAIFLASLWCLFRITYRVDGPVLFGLNNPMYGDWAIIALYIFILAASVFYFGFDLEKVAKTITQIAQFLVLAFGVASFQWGGAGRFIGMQASFVNFAAAVLLFLFLSALTLAFVFKDSQSSES